MEYKLSEQELKDLMHRSWLKAKKFYSGKTDEYFYDYFEREKKQLPIHGVVGCQREQLKTTKEPLPYDEWKKHLKIQKPNNQIYQIGDEYITLNEVLEMYEDYYHSF